MDSCKMLLRLFGVFSLLGFLEGTTTPSSKGCYTQPPGRKTVMTCMDKYAVMPNNLYCLKNIRRHPLPDKVKNEIVSRHNTIRSAVSPKAASMLSLKYNEGLGRTAQVWAEACQLQPSKPIQRFRPGIFGVGENVYVSKSNKSWSDVIDIWAQEKSSFTFGSGGNDLRLVSNYTQIVWAQTSAVGCAKAVCSGQYFYVCHYAPAMTSSHFQQPYESSKTSCSRCLSNCSNSLCDCSRIICLNGAALNFSTCWCDCISAVKTYTAPTCELNCDRNGDDPKCGTVYKKSACATDFETMYHCPWLCDICPYAGKNYRERSIPLPWERNRTECTPPPTTIRTIPSGTATGKHVSLTTRMNSPGGANPAPKLACSKGSPCENGSRALGFKAWVVAISFILTINLLI